MMQFSGFQRICATVQTSPQPTSECDCHSEKASSPLPSRLGSWTSHRPWTARCALAVSASVPTWGYFLVTFTAAVVKKYLCKNNLMKEENVYYFLSNLSIFFENFMYECSVYMDGGWRVVFTHSWRSPLSKGIKGARAWNCLESIHIQEEESNECCYLALSLLLISLRPKPEIGATSGDGDSEASWWSNHDDDLIMMVSHWHG